MYQGATIGRTHIDSTHYMMSKHGGLGPATVRGGARRPFAIAFLFAIVTLSACAVRRAPGNLESPPCRRAAQGGPAEWVLREAPDERTALDAWCWAVGPPVILDSSVRPAAGTDSFAVVVWNTHVGAADLRSFVQRLRTGELTGEPVPDFVILLQEVHRAGAAVPPTVPEWASVARRFGDPDAPGREDVIDVATAESLSVIYAPSMRNGSADDGRAAEDRGNAILSSLPLTAPQFVELPYERHRRVAVVAHVTGLTSAGTPWSIRLANLHLDNRSRMGRLLRSFGSGRADQARAMVEALAESEQPTILGGDFNTWLGGTEAEAVQIVRDAFPLPTTPPDEATLPLPWPLPDLRLDHLFFRLPEGWHAEVRVLHDTFGSDHKPLLGWVYTPAADRSPELPDRSRS